MSAKSQSILWVAQRASATVLALCVIVHLATVIYAVQGGLTAAEILSRTQGNIGWFVFYTGFVAAVAIHAPIGLRTILSEWFGWRSSSRDLLLLIFAATIAVGGMRAVVAVFA